MSSSRSARETMPTGSRASRTPAESKLNRNRRAGARRVYCGLHHCRSYKPVAGPFRAVSVPEPGSRMADQQREAGRRLREPCVSSARV
jgi:hypothetical protein